jgi:Response regulator containing CheY-like receiver, AAA-type ATPase, and DNA-binding domains
MDEMDGIELIREMKKRDIHIPIVGMSGHTVGSKFLSSMRFFGVKTTLLKSFSKDELLAAIAYALSS